jgi:hypothetical protein
MTVSTILLLGSPSHGRTPFACANRVTHVNVEGVQKSTCSKLGATARRVASTRKNHEKTHLGNSSLVFCPLGRRQCRARGRSAVGGLSRKRAYAWKVAPALRILRESHGNMSNMSSGSLPASPGREFLPWEACRAHVSYPFPHLQTFFFFLGRVGVSVFDLNFTVTRVQQRGLLGEQWLKVDFRPFLSHVGGEG